MEIFRELVAINPQANAHYLARTSVNLSSFYLKVMPNKEKSLSYAMEALLAAHPFGAFLGVAQQYRNSALEIAEAWGLDKTAFYQESLASKSVP